MVTSRLEQVQSTIRMVALCITLFAIPLKSQNEFWVHTDSPSGAKVSTLSPSPGGKIYMNAGLVYSSTDRGDTWQQLSAPANFTSFFFLTADTVLAGSSAGVYRSTDAGSSWSVVSVSNLIVSVFGLDAKGNVLLGSGLSGLYRSTDRGLSWSFLSLYGMEIGSLGLDSSGVLYVSGLYPHYAMPLRSTDNGSTWSQMPSLRPFVTAFSTTADGKVFAADDSGLYRSSDHGISWNQLSAPHSYICGIAQNSSGYIYVGYPSGMIYVSSDVGLSWNSIGAPWDSTGTPLGRYATLMTMDPSGDMFFGTGDEGVYRSTNSGTSWQQINRGLPYIRFSHLAARGKGEVLAGSDLYFAYRTTDAGATWTRLFPVWGFTQVTGVAIHPSGTYLVGTFTSGAEGFYTYDARRSTNGGADWTRYMSGKDGGALCYTVDVDGSIFQGRPQSGVARSTDEGITWAPATPYAGFVNDVHASMFSRKLFAVFWNTGLFRSTDSGVSWSQMNIDYSYFPLTTSTAGDLFAGHGPSGVFHSTDDGITWVSTSLINCTVHCVTANSLHQIFVGSDQGAFVSRDNGVVWNRINGGLTDTNVVSLALDTAGYVYSTVQTGGIYRSRYSTLTDVSSRAESSPTEFELLQNYPNPFNPMTVIRYVLPEDARVRLTLYDILGREVARLIDGVVPAGYHKAEINASNFASGVYFYKLEASATSGRTSYNSLKKMLVLK